MGLNYAVRKCVGKNVRVMTVGGEEIRGLMLDSKKSLQLFAQMLGSEVVIAMSDGVFIARPDVKKMSYVANSDVKYIDLVD